MNGKVIYNWIKDLFPICRSLTGKGTSKTLQYIKKIVPEMKIKHFTSGAKVFDWKIPSEWNVNDAWIKNSNGKKIIDFKKNNLHLVGYSTPINKKIKLNDLKKHLFTLPKQPNAIPYVTSYYKKNWGFCINYNQYKSLKNNTYHVLIDSTLKKGSLKYGELVFKGKLKKEIFLSTYICHPSMANNELSGPCVTVALAKWIKSKKNKHKYTYRIIFIPETIGSIAYLSRNLKVLKENMVAGFNISCVGDEKSYSLIHTPDEKTLADKVALKVMTKHTSNFIKYSFLKRGSDERQYCSPSVSLPVVGICRSKYGTFPEYHTSLDNLNFITPKGLEGGYKVIKKILEFFEKEKFYYTNITCEPHLSKRKMYRTLSSKLTMLNSEEKNITNFLAYANGKRDLAEIGEKTKTNPIKFIKIIKKLEKEKLIKFN